MNFTELVDRLAGGGRVIRMHDGSVMIRCTAHDDRKASLHISEGRSGLVIHCHAECLPTDVLQAAGLTLADLYERPEADDPPTKGKRPRVHLNALRLSEIGHEATIAIVVLLDISKGYPISERDRVRARQAARYLQNFLRELER
jgi:hypothetical protein